MKVARYRRYHAEQKHALYALVDPISPPPKPVPAENWSTVWDRAWVEAPGTAPGSDGFITTAIYRHSRIAPAQRNISAEGYRRKSGRFSQKLGLRAGAGSFRRSRRNRAREI